MAQAINLQDDAAGALTFAVGTPLPATTFDGCLLTVNGGGGRSIA